MSKFKAVILAPVVLDIEDAKSAGEAQDIARAWANTKLVKLHDEVYYGKLLVMVGPKDDLEAWKSTIFGPEEDIELDLEGMEDDGAEPTDGERRATADGRAEGGDGSHPQ